MAHLKQVFPTPTAFQTYLAFYSKFITGESDVGSVDSILTQLLSFFQDPYFTLNKKLSDTLTTLTSLGGFSLIEGLKSLTITIDKAHPVIHYFANELDMTDLNKMEKYYHSLQILLRVYKASLHTTSASLVDMEKNYIISVLTKPDHENYAYDIGSHETARKKVLLSFQEEMLEEDDLPEAENAPDARLRIRKKGKRANP